MTDSTGNSLLVEKLLAKANAQVHLNTQVTSITRLGNRKSFWDNNALTSSTKNKYIGYSVATVPAQDMANPHAVQEEIFDEVVLAAPIEFASIRFLNISLPSIRSRIYYYWYFNTCKITNCIVLLWCLTVVGLLHMWLPKQLIPPTSTYHPQLKHHPLCLLRRTQRHHSTLLLPKLRYAKTAASNIYS